MGKWQGLIGIILIFTVAFLYSNNKKKINLRLVITGFVLQIFIAFLILKVTYIQFFLLKLSYCIKKLEYFGRTGINFITDGLIIDTPNGFQNIANNTHSGFVFILNVTATIIIVCVLVAIFYQLNIIQKVVGLIAKGIKFIMPVSGSEALGNVGSMFLGQIEAQILIKPYLKNMTKSELLAIMSGSLACISGAILIVYVNMGAKAEYLLASSVMAVPGSLVISKIVYPETVISETFQKVNLKFKKPYINLFDAISKSSLDGLKLSASVFGTLIGVIALIALINFGLHKIDSSLSLDYIFSKIFYPFAWSMGVPSIDLNNASILLGQKISINEFIAFRQLTSTPNFITTEKGLAIISFAICGFANFGSVGMLISGIGYLAPERVKDIAKLGFKALICGTLASYLSATIVGIIIG